METKIIQDGQVVITNTVNLADFVAQKQAELEMIGQQIEAAAQRQQAILSELESLITE